MARQAIGQVVERDTKAGRVYALRFRADGQRRCITLGSREGGWTSRRAETDLQNVLPDVRRGTWRPPVDNAAVLPPSDPTFHEFASEWFDERKAEWRENTRNEVLWCLRGHLLPFFAGAT